MLLEYFSIDKIRLAYTIYVTGMMFLIPLLVFNSGAKGLLTKIRMTLNLFLYATVGMGFLIFLAMIWTKY